MRLTKYEHACVTIEADGTTILVDPGAWAEQGKAMLSQADAVLITHDHFDHYDAEAIAAEVARRPDLAVYGPESITVEGVTTVATGDTHTVGGIEIRAVVQPHAIIYGDQPQIPNAGFLIGGTVYHPGDTLAVPDLPIETLLVPTSGPWLKLGEVIQFVKDTAPKRAIQIHNMLNSEAGAMVTTQMGGPDGFGDLALDLLEVGEATDV